MLLTGLDTSLHSLIHPCGPKTPRIWAGILAGLRAVCGLFAWRSGGDWTARQGRREGAAPPQGVGCYGFITPLSYNTIFRFYSTFPPFFRFSPSRFSLQGVLDEGERGFRGGVLWGVGPSRGVSGEQGAGGWGGRLRQSLSGDGDVVGVEVDAEEVPVFEFGGYEGGA